MTQSTPRPSAPPTSSFPPRGGRCVAGRSTKPRVSPSGVASTSTPRSGPSPLNSSDRRSSRLMVAARSSAPVSARPSAAVAVGAVRWRPRASSTRSVVTAASARTVPPWASARASRSATCRSGGLAQPFQHLVDGYEPDEAAALPTVGTEQHVGGDAGNLPACHERLGLLVLRGHVCLERGEITRGPHDLRIAEGRALHLPARKAPRGLEVDQHRPAALRSEEHTSELQALRH